MSEIIMVKPDRIRRDCCSYVKHTVENERALLRRFLLLAAELQSVWKGKSSAVTEAEMYEDIQYMEQELNKLEDWAGLVEKKLEAFEEIDRTIAGRMDGVTMNLAEEWMARGKDWIR